ncbi:hypothetical protein Lesp02_05850 [Lentzea sp. NBRC 105346]|uniref:hypothetical protein n=1 Tax=Lentzea sp. NBRC 105346 TaxID=3032205 RepID=UPI0024A0F386|nr:hypothetical protein [Lentzea sp. NBRC 105346]GLZ28395.1 hypothetical protein Lesp02_05850 [Lentzea sp. NBRC 105346]
MNNLARAGAIAAAVVAIGGGTCLPAMATPQSGTPTIMSGSSEQSRNGLTCKNKWYTTLGKTNCSGNSGQRWRLIVKCAFQGDIKGTWQQGPGSDQAECNFHVQSATVEWK